MLVIRQFYLPVHLRCISLHFFIFFFQMSITKHFSVSKYDVPFFCMLHFSVVKMLVTANSDLVVRCYLNCFRNTFMLLLIFIFTPLGFQINLLKPRGNSLNHFLKSLNFCRNMSSDSRNKQQLFLI